VKKIVDKVLEKYPAKTFKTRKKHIIVKDDSYEIPQIEANTRTIPGIITNRGCCFAGCKGVVVGPIKDMVHIVHGPIGCAYYTWGTRRNKAKTEEGKDNFIEYCFSTDMQESDIVFGGEKKLRQAIKEAMDLFNPKAISISATCPVGLIGDDINAIAAEAEKQYGIQVLAFNCEGYKGVSQSAGHHIANNNFIKNVIGKGDKEYKKTWNINLLGEYNIGGDTWEIERILNKIGYNIVATLTGDESLENIRNAHKADLNLVQCHRSINYIAEMIETKYGIPWVKVNFIGIDATIQTLRDMAKIYDDPELTKRTEEVIAEEIAAIEGELVYLRQRLEGKTAFLYVGGSRSHHYQNLLATFGIETVLSGYEFAHRDDYEGRDVIPSIKPDADSKNIEELKVEKDKENYRIILSEERYEKLKEEVPNLGEYAGLIKESKKNNIIIDDLNHYETETFIKVLKPDMFFSGIKDKYAVQKMGVMAKQLHSYDYSGPYAGFKGAVIFAKDVLAGVYTPGWRYVTPPWKTEPLIEGTIEKEGAAC